MQYAERWQDAVKDLKLIVWLTQLGLSVALPLVGFILLSVWLRNDCGWGAWVIPVGVIIGVICAFDGFRTSMKAMEHMSRNKKEQEKPPVSFNDHD
jgi:hypothetical protein